ncbi:MAG: hypothetical protein IRZ32_08975 [Solirubrobacteraceae bacterium]|nr:hypothetical protein [Solirubrobacteraceae bacterium]
MSVKAGELQLRPIDAHAARLRCSVDELRDAVDAWNADPRQALKLVVRNDHVGLVADPHLEIPAPPTAVRARGASAALDADRLLWQVIDRQLPDPVDDDLAARLAGLEAAGLVTELDDEWRPTDHVIELFGRTDWDTSELIAFGRGRTTPA